MVAGSKISWHGIKRKAVYTEGAGLICKCMGQCTLEGSVQGEGVDTGCAKLFNWLLKLTNWKQSKVTCLIRH